MSQLWLETAKTKPSRVAVWKHKHTVETILRMTGWERLTYSNVAGWKVLYDSKSPRMRRIRDRWDITLFGGGRFEGNKRSKQKKIIPLMSFQFLSGNRLLKSSTTHTHTRTCTVSFMFILNDSSVVSPVLLKVKVKETFKLKLQSKKNKKIYWCFPFLQRPRHFQKHNTVILYCFSHFIASSLIVETNTVIVSGEV